MLPLNLSFRRMLLKYIPQLRPQDLDRFDSLVGLRHQAKQEFNFISSGSGQPAQQPFERAVFRAADAEVNQLLEPYRRLYRAVQRLYIARRKVAVKHGRFQQVPSSLGDFKRFIRVHLDYYGVAARTLPGLTVNRIGFYFRFRPKPVGHETDRKRSKPPYQTGPVITKTRTKKSKGK